MKFTCPRCHNEFPDYYREADGLCTECHLAAYEKQHRNGEKDAITRRRRTLRDKALATRVKAR